MDLRTMTLGVWRVVATLCVAFPSSLLAEERVATFSPNASATFTDEKSELSVGVTLRPGVESASRYSGLRVDAALLAGKSQEGKPFVDLNDETSAFGAKLDLLYESLSLAMLRAEAPSFKDQTAKSVSSSVWSLSLAFRENVFKFTDSTGSKQEQSRRTWSTEAGFAYFSESIGDQVGGPAVPTDSSGNVPAGTIREYRAAYLVPQFRIGFGTTAKAGEKVALLPGGATTDAQLLKIVSGEPTTKSQVRLLAALGWKPESMSSTYFAFAFRYEATAATNSLSDAFSGDAARTLRAEPWVFRLHGLDKDSAWRVGLAPYISMELSSPIDGEKQGTSAGFRLEVSAIPNWLVVQ